MTPKTIHFLCTGNYFRSRFAEIVFNAASTKMGLPYVARSTGLALERGFNNKGPIAKETAMQLAKLGIKDLVGVSRMPRPTQTEELQTSERVIALLEKEHRPLLAERHPGWEEQVEYWHIEDEPGVLPSIEQEVMGLISRLLGGVGSVAEPAEEAKPAKPEKPKKRGIARVGRETAGRRGKGVTTVFDLGMTDEELKELCTKLKQMCGTGGTVKDSRIEIQGDHRDKIMKELEKLGYQVKRSGG